jgi:hypothetical protein
MAKRTDEEIVALIEEEERISYGTNDDELSSDRAKAISYYLGAPLGNEVEGRSQVVSFDVQDTIEAALPQLIKIFASGDQVVRFEPRGPDDEAAAEQETDYINYVVMERNRGFETIYTWFKDALLSKNGYVKIYYDETDEVEEEKYRGLSEAQLMMLAKDDDVTIIEHESYLDQDQFEMMQQQYQQVMMEYQQAAQQAQMQGQPMQPPPPEPQPPMLFDVKIEKRNTKGCVKIANVPPENIKVSVDTPGLNLQNARFVQHSEMMSKADIKANGWKTGGTEGNEHSESWSTESDARDLYNEDSGGDKDILVKDSYYKIDGERWRYVIIGQKVVLKEKTDCVPIACLSPMLMPHRHIGRSYADLTMDIQLVKTALIRGQLDNMYLSNNGRYAISDRVNLEDMLTSRPGGVVRVQGEPGNAILPLQHTAFPPTSFTMVQYLDSMKEKRTGVTAYNQGLDADSLNKTATGINAIMNAAAARLELVARLFGETGVKDMFLLVHRLIRQNYTKPDILKLRGKWIQVDPREWVNRSDMTINVGLGTGNKDQQLMHIQSVLMAQKEAIQIGVASPKNIYNALIKLTQAAGFKHPDEFWTDPESVPSKPEEPPLEIQVEKIRAESKKQETQAKLQAEQQKFQAEAQIKQSEFSMEADLERFKAEMKQKEEQVRSQNDVAIERDKLQMQAELERYKAELKAETDLKIAQMEIEMKAIEMQRQHQKDMQKAAIDDRRHQEKMEAMTKAKKVTRDESGRVSGVE